jgi:Protein of unknown function (DUF2510)
MGATYPDPMTPAGWYRDPYGDPALLRWWDGHQWTQATQPLGPGPQGSWDWNRAPGQGQTPAPPWAPPGADPPTGHGRSRLPLLLGGGAAALIVIAVVAILLATDVFGGGDRPAAGNSGPPGTGNSGPPGNGGSTGGRSPVAGTITDTRAGLSYPRLAGAWRASTVSPTSGVGKLGFDQGETAPVMADFENGRPYVASAYSGVSTDTGNASLEARARAVLAVLEPTAYPVHTRQELASTSHPVDGHPGRLLKVKLTFPQAESQGWNFRGETIAIVVIDRGTGKAPALFYVSIPDSHSRPGDLDLLLTSLKVS